MTPTSSTIDSVELPQFDFDRFFDAVNEARGAQALGWFELADELWKQSADLNDIRDDHRLRGGAVFIG